LLKPNRWIDQALNPAAESTSDQSTVDTISHAGPLLHPEPEPEVVVTVAVELGLAVLVALALAGLAEELVDFALALL